MIFRVLFFSCNFSVVCYFWCFACDFVVIFLFLYLYVIFCDFKECVPKKSVISPLV